MISFMNVSKSFGHRLLYHQVNLVIHKNEIMVLKGASGSGKTTLLNIIIGRETCTTGEVSISKGVTIGIVPQDYGIIDDLSIKSNLRIGSLKWWQISPLKMKRYLAEVGLSYLCNLNKLARHLSGGEKQRLSITRLLLLRRDVLIFDEPTSNLDDESTQKLLQIMKQLAQHNRTIIIVTHDYRLLRELPLQYEIKNQQVSKIE